MKPPMPYYGGKQTVADQIVAMFPEHDGYVEPYAGGLAVLFAKPAERMEIVNDINEDLVTFWRVLRDRTDELIHVCQLTPHSRNEMRLSWTREGVDELERARRVWVLLTQGRSSNWLKTGWRFYLDPHGTSSSMAQYLTGYKARLAPAAERLMNVQLECRDALDVIADYGKHESNLLYIDPPYLGETRNSIGYAHEMRDEADHVALLESLVTVNAAVVLSGYASPLYDEYLGEWSFHDIGSRTQGAPRVERVWSNRPPMATLFSFATLATGGTA